MIREIMTIASDDVAENVSSSTTGLEPSILMALLPLNIVHLYFAVL